MLNLDLTITREGNIFTPKDSTGLYAAEKEGGWGAPNKTRADVVKATIYLYFNKNFVTEVDVTDLVKASADEEVEFDPIVINDFGDGVYVFTYDVQFSDTEQPMEYFSKKTVYVTDLLKANLSKLWAALACMYNSYEYGYLAKECIWIDAHERTLYVFERRGDEKNFLALLNIAQERVNINAKHL